MNNLKIILLLYVVLTSSFISAQNLYPEKEVRLDFNPERIEKFNSKNSWLRCNELTQKLYKEGRDLQSPDLTTEEKKILHNCDDLRSNIWQTTSDGDNWYDCVFEPGLTITVDASSFLQSQGNFTYDPKNAHDFSYKTAWVEGVSGYGIGEYLVYTFSANNPIINTIKIVNGYVKSISDWQKNSRVKKLKMYINDEEFVYLNLKDIYAEQHFYIPEIGGDYQDDWKIKFEIMEVYKGNKYDDVVISEIFFEGVCH